MSGSQHNPNGRQAQLGSGWSPLQLQMANLLARAPQAHMASERGVTWHTPTPPPHLYHVPAPSSPDPLQAMKGAGNSVFRHTATPPELYRHTPTPPDKHLLRHTPSPGDVKAGAPLPPADLYAHLGPGRDKLVRPEDLLSYARGVDLSLSSRGANGAPAAPALSVRDAPTINSLIARVAPRPLHARVDSLLERLAPAPAEPHSVIVHPRAAPTPSPPSSNEDSADSCGAPPGSKRKRKPERVQRVPLPPLARLSPPRAHLENGDSHANGPPEKEKPPSPEPHVRRKTRSGSAETIDDIAAMIASTDRKQEGEAGPPSPKEEAPEPPVTIDKLKSVLASPEKKEDKAEDVAPSPPKQDFEEGPSSTGGGDPSSTGGGGPSSTGGGGPLSTGDSGPSSTGGGGPSSTGGGGPSSTGGSGPSSTGGSGLSSTGGSGPSSTGGGGPSSTGGSGLSSTGGSGPSSTGGGGPSSTGGGNPSSTGDSGPSSTGGGGHSSTSGGGPSSTGGSGGGGVAAPRHAHCHVPVESPSEGRPAEPEGSEPTAAFVEVENQLEKMFAGIEEAPSNQEEGDQQLVKEKPPTTRARKRRKSAPVKGERASTGRDAKKRKPARARDKDAYDSGSNASSSRSRGPYIQIRGPRSSPLSVSVINAGAEDEAEAPGARRRGDFRNGLRARGLHCSTLGLRYDATTPDATWLCAFCERGPHAAGLGDLFGPYPLDTDCVEYRELDEVARRRPEGGAAWVHEACAVWAPGLLAAGARLWGLSGAVWSCRGARCAECARGGATLACSARGCRARAHVPCARAAWALREEDFRATCPHHAAS